MLVRILVLFFLNISFASAAMLTYSSSWSYFDGPAYPQYQVYTESFLTFTGEEVQKGVQSYEQIYQELWLQVTYEGMQFRLDIDESQAKFENPYGIGDHVALTGTETETIPGTLSTWQFLTYTTDGPGVPADTQVILIDVNDSNRFLRGSADGEYLVWSPVPVPAAVWLFVSGLAGLLCFMRRGK